MTSEEILCRTALSAWKQVVDRASKRLLPMSEEQLQAVVAPGRNRLIYLLGHLVVVHDMMLPVLRVGDRLYPQLEEAFLKNPDGAVESPMTVEELKAAWTRVNQAVGAGIGELTPAQWVERHGSVSEEDFVTAPERNRFAILLSRTNHLAFHMGQIVLVK